MRVGALRSKENCEKFYYSFRKYKYSKYWDDTIIELFTHIEPIPAQHERSARLIKLSITRFSNCQLHAAVWMQTLKLESSEYHFVHEKRFASPTCLCLHSQHHQQQQQLHNSHITLWLKIITFYLRAQFYSWLMHFPSYFSRNRFLRKIVR